MADGKIQIKLIITNRIFANCCRA